MALYSNLPRSADVVTDTACQLRKFSLENFLRMERDCPEVARQFHSFVVRLLATRLAAAHEEIEALLYTSQPLLLRRWCEARLLFHCEFRLLQCQTQLNP